MILTNEERQKFILYLRQNIEDGRLIIEQMKKLPMGDSLTKPEKIRISAWLVVVADLESIESYEISAKDPK